MKTNIFKRSYLNLCILESYYSSKKDDSSNNKIQLRNNVKCLLSALQKVQTLILIILSSNFVNDFLVWLFDLFTLLFGCFILKMKPFYIICFFLIAMLIFNSKWPSVYGSVYLPARFSLNPIFTAAIQNRRLIFVLKFACHAYLLYSSLCPSVLSE